MSDDLHKKLSVVRTEIDTIDAQLLDLLNRRARCAQLVGEIKAQHGEAGFIYRPEREAQVLRRIQENNPGPLPNDSVTWFFREVMSACLSLEQRLGVAFLGPLGTFSESAAVKHFGHAVRLLPQNSIDDVFREVESGHADFAVVPIENSTEGAIGRTLDLLMTTPLKVCGEVVLRIHQHLLSKEASLGKITRVYSHAQSLAQCHEWLNRTLPEAQRISMGSNAQAAQVAAGEAGSAAIAGEAAAERYDLPKLASNIEDEPNNTTRFVVIGRQEAGASGRDKTSLIMSTQNRTGSLCTLLAPFSEAGVSMTGSNPDRRGIPCGVRILRRYRRASGGCHRRDGAGRAWPPGALSQGAWLVPGRSLLITSFSQGKYMALCDQSLPNVRAISPYQPGKPITQLAREMGIPVERIVKLASNENPLGVSPLGLAAMRQCQSHRGGALSRRQRFRTETGARRSHFGVGDGVHIVLGNGSNDVLDQVARAFLAPGRSKRSTRSTRLPSIRSATLDYRRANGIEVPAQAISATTSTQCRAVRLRPQTRMVFIANPNNPTGTLVPYRISCSSLSGWRCRTKVVVVLDEAYNEYHRFDQYKSIQRRLAEAEFPNLRDHADVFQDLRPRRACAYRLRPGLAHESVADLMNRVRRAFQLSTASDVGRRERRRSTIRDFIRKELCEVNRDGHEADCRQGAERASGLRNTFLLSATS